jgi:mono/diheme cytochrome c family protein
MTRWIFASLLGAGLLGMLATDGATAQTASPAAAAPAGDAERGKQTFVKAGCFECHGREGQGSPATGPRLAPDPIPFEAVQSEVREPANVMPAYSPKVLSDAQLRDIYAYLASRPQPPALKDIPALAQ